MTRGIVFDDRGHGPGLVVLTKSVWTRIAQLVESEWGWNEKEFMEMVGDSGSIAKQRQEEELFRESP